MGAIRFYIDKKTGLAVGSDEVDGRGRIIGSEGFKPELYDDTGYNNPNIQLNYAVKKEYEIVDIPTNTDAFLDSVGSGRSRRYAWTAKSEALWNEKVLQPIEKYSSQIYQYQTISKNKNKQIDPEIPDVFEYDDPSDRKIREAKEKLDDIAKKKEKFEKIKPELEENILQLQKEVYSLEDQLKTINEEQSGNFDPRGKAKQKRTKDTGNLLSFTKKELEEAKKLYEESSKIDDEEKIFQSLNESSEKYNPNYDYEKLLDLQNTIAVEQNKKVDEINSIENPDEKQKAIQEYLPFYEESYKYVSQKLANLELRINEKRKNVKMTIDPDLPELGSYDENTDYDKLYNLQDLIISEQNKRFDEINLLQDPAERFVAKEQDIKQYDDYLDFANQKISNLDAKVSDVRNKRKSNISFNEIGDDYTYNDLVDYRNEVALKQNEKVNEINMIQDPAERYVAIEQDFPIFSNKLNEYDEKINQYGNILENRKPVDINFNRDRRGNLEINLGGRQGKFRNTRRGAMEAENFYAQSKSDYIKDLSSADPITKNASLEQDKPYLEYNEKVVKQQRKAQKNQEMQNLINMNNSYTGDFGAVAPSDTPTGTVRVPTPPLNMVPKSGLDKIFGDFKEPDFSGGYNFNPKGKRRKKNSYENFF